MKIYELITEEHTHVGTQKEITKNENTLNIRKLVRSDLQNDSTYRIAHSDIDPGNTYVFLSNKDYKQLKKHLYLNYLEPKKLPGNEVLRYMETELGWGSDINNLNIKYIP